MVESIVLYFLGGGRQKWEKYILINIFRIKVHNCSELCPELKTTCSAVACEFRGGQYLLFLLIIYSFFHLLSLRDTTKDRQHVNYTAEYFKISAYLSLDFLTLYSKVNKWKKWSCLPKK